MTYLLKRSLAFAATIALSMLVMPQAQAQTVEDAIRVADRLPAVGVRLSGMGGASIGGIGDYGALYSNPAGLAYYKGSALSGTLGFNTATNDAVFEGSGFREGFDNEFTSTQLGNLAYVYAFPVSRGSLVFGVTFNRTNDFDRELRFDATNPSGTITEFFLPFGDEFSVTEIGAGDDGQLGTFDDDIVLDFSRPLSFAAFETFATDLDRDFYEQTGEVAFLPAVASGTSVRQQGRVLETGGINELNVGGAVEAAENVMVGVGLNVVFGNYEFRSTFEEIDERNENDGNFGTTDFASLFYENRFETDMVGVNLRGGVSFQATPALRIGFSAETPTYMVMDEAFSGIVETQFDNGDVFVYGDEVVEDAFDGTFEYELRTPWRFGVGGVYQIGRLTVAADLEFVDWTQMEYSSDGFDAALDATNDEIRDGLDATTNVRVGAEYRLGKFDFRLGGGTSPDPRNDSYLRGASLRDLQPDRQRQYGSLGFGYRFSDQFRLDAAWTAQRFEDLYLPYSEVDNIPYVTEEVTRSQFVVGLTLLY
ncbi:MAG: hypothetical protein AAF730_01670 [Bacteroidota bacterium]